MNKQEYIYRVSIKDELAGNVWTTDYYFTSLSAIYEQLSAGEDLRHFSYTLKMKNSFTFF